MREVPYRNFKEYAYHPLFHQFKPFDEKDRDAVEKLSRLEKPESITPFEMKGKFAAGPITSKWTFNSILNTGRVLPKAVHQYIAKRVRKIFEDLNKLKEKIRVTCNPYDNLEIWWIKSGYVLKYKTTFIESEAAALQPEVARKEVFRILASRTRRGYQSCTSYEDMSSTQLQDKDHEEAWQEAMADALFFKDS